MKLFIKKIIIFSLFFSLLISVFWFVSFLAFNRVSFKIPNDKTILVIGDSHTECAINDQILTQAFNISQSDIHHFYSFIKLRKILSENPHIKTVVISYYYEDFNIIKDDRLSDSRYLEAKLPIHFFLMTVPEILLLIKDYPFDLFKIFITAPKNLVKDVMNDKSITINKKWGGYLYLERDKLNEDLELLKERITGAPLDVSAYDSLYLKYLKKMYELSIENGKDVYLINTPVFIEVIREDEYLENYNNFANLFLPKAHVLNHASLEIPIEGYGDSTHLNYKGAIIYSNFLKEEVFLKNE